MKNSDRKSLSTQKYSDNRPNKIFKAYKEINNSNNKQTIRNDSNIQRNNNNFSPKVENDFKKEIFRPLLSSISNNNQETQFNPLQKISNIFLSEYEKNVKNCNCICVNTCSNTNYCKLITCENEETQENTRKNPNEFNSSSKSFLILILSVLLSSIHFSYYRKIAGKSIFFYTDKEITTFFSFEHFLSEMNLFTWRYQIVSILLFLYFFLSNYFMKNHRLENLEWRITIFDQEQNNNINNNKSHEIKINFSEILTLENMKNISFITLSSFLLFLSIFFIPISMSLGIQYLSILLRFYTRLNLNYEKRTNKLFRIIVIFLTSIGIILVLSNNFIGNEKNLKSFLENEEINLNTNNDILNEIKNLSNYIDINDTNFKQNKTEIFSSVVTNSEISNINQNKLKNKSIINLNNNEKLTKSNSSQNVTINKEIPENKNIKYKSNFELKYMSFISNLIGILLSLSSGIINIIYCDDIYKYYMKNNSPLNLIMIFNFNSAIITTIINFVINSYAGNPFFIITWIFEFKNGLNIVVIGLGLVAFLNIMLTIFTSVYLNIYYLKFLKIIEIPLADTVGSILFSIYKYNYDISYYVGFINITIVIIMIEFSDFFLDKKKIKKFNF